MNEFILKDTLLGFIDCENLIRRYKKTIDTYVYNWIVKHYGLYDRHLPTKEQVGRAYIGPNPNFDEDPEENKCEWGWTWHLTPDMKSIRIEFTTIKNQWLDVDDENIVTFTLEEFINEFTK